MSDDFATMSDVQEELTDIDDDLLILIVQANPCLYAKNDKFFKDNKLKEMKWQTIAETFNCSASTVKKRWDSLRNQFSRKLRQQKNQPSGSAGTSSEWPLMSCMSFLMPHIQNRKTRGSSLQISSSRCSETSSNNSNISPVSSHIATRVQPSVASVSCIDFGFSNTDDCLSTSAENTAESECGVIIQDNQKIGSFPQTPKTHKKRMLVPPLDKFAKKKKVINERLEDMLNKSSQAVSDLATAYKDGKVEEKKENYDPNAAVIANALKLVTQENQTTCLIAVLQLIESYQR